MRIDLSAKSFAVVKAEVEEHRGELSKWVLYGSLETRICGLPLRRKICNRHETNELVGIAFREMGRG